MSQLSNVNLRMRHAGWNDSRKGHKSIVSLSERHLPSPSSSRVQQFITDEDGFTFQITIGRLPICESGRAVRVISEHFERKDGTEQE
ncbi:hypothetical protein CDAR_91691 [Caerostris darwini]|uniref:Uncharacterized protein n=1 Tax=Caerostris darwini TaxID=1538125 RepID=A0AAV4QNY6_9ARAC|nr:hypothetical protein CDAR_91691 [Caerostris darwini]